MKACVSTARLFDAKMGDFFHTAKRRGAFAQLSRRKSSKLLAVPCGFLLISGQNRYRLNSTLVIGRP